MLKFFRKYRKWLVSIGGSVLMLVFLISLVPGALTGGDRGGSDVVGLLEGRKVRTTDLAEAGNDLAVLGWLRVANPSEKALSWHLKLHAARRMGIEVSNAEVNQALEELELDAPEALAKFTQTHRVGEALVRQALAHALMVGKLRAQTDGAGPLSERAALQFLQLTGAQAHIQTVPVSLREWEQRAAAPSEQAVRDLFERYKDALPGTGRPYGFGYRVPNRVQVEWLEIALPELRKLIKPAEYVNIQEAKEYYAKHRDDFREMVPATQPAASATQPAALVAVQRQFHEVAERIYQILRDLKAEARGREMVEVLRQRLMAAEPAAPRDELYRPITAEWMKSGMLDLVKAAQAISLEDKYRGLQPEVYRETRWIPTGRVSLLPGRLADATRSMGEGADEATFREYIESAKELSPKADNRLLADRLQVGVVSKPMRGRDGTLYLFRLTAAQAEHTPTLSDPEIIAQVQIDARRLAAYELLKADLPRIQADLAKALVTGDMDQVARERGLVTGAKKPPGFPRRDMAGGLAGPQVAFVGRSAEFADGVFEVIDGLHRQGRRVADVPPAQRCAAVLYPQALSQPADQMHPLHLVLIERVQFLEEAEARRRVVYWGQILPRLLASESGVTPPRDELLRFKQMVGWKEADGSAPVAEH